MLFPTVGGVVVGLLHQCAAAGFPNERGFDNARIHGFTEGCIANNMFEQESFIIFGGGGEIQLGDEFAAAAG